MSFERENRRSLSSPAALVLSWILGGVFVYAGILKVMDPVQFARDIDNYQILPWSGSALLAFYLPWLEILCGLSLIVRRLYTGGLTIVTVLVLTFIAASVLARARGIDISCGCFGHFSKNWGFRQHLLLDVALFALVLVLWVLEFGRRRALSSS